MNRYEILNVDKHNVGYYDAETDVKAVLLYFRETGKIDGPWLVTNIATGVSKTIECAFIVALAYYENNVEEPTDTWILV